MSTALAMKDNVSAEIERVVIGGDLSKLSPADRVSYYQAVCKSLGLNPLTRPFDYITLNGKLTLYARKDCTDQLRKIHNISIDKPDIHFEDEWIVVSVLARDKDGRTDADTGVVSRKDMRGDFGNALMKAVTKAKRRVTLSICGLGMSDETEVETIPQARPVAVDATTGEIIEGKSEPISKPDAVTITKVEERKDAMGAVLGYLVTFSDGREGRTLDAAIARQAEIFRDNKNPVEPVLERNKRDTSKLVLIELGALDQAF